MDLSQIVDIIILVGAFVVAITNIYKFVSNGGLKIKKKVDDVREREEQELQEKIDARVMEKVQPMLDQTARTLTASFEGLLDKHLPKRLEQHDLETRKKYLSDRQKYLEDITNEVVFVMQERLNSVETHEEQMLVFTEVLKELLRERIMEIYRRNKQIRRLEDHERFELKTAYASYKSINGNSYIDEYYAIMEQWETVPDEK